MTDMGPTAPEGEPPPDGTTRAASGGWDDETRHPAQRLRRALVGSTPGRPGESATAAAPQEPDFELQTLPEDRPPGPRAGLRHGVTRRVLVTAVSLSALVGAATATLISSPISHPAPAAVATPTPMPIALPAAPPIRPSARVDAAMAYDPAGGDVILFGGLVIGSEGLTTLSDTWSWDGSQWTELHPTVSPPGLSGALLAYDPSTERLVLTGGDTARPGGPLEETDSTWTWDGSTWASQPAGTLPAADLPSALGTDSATGQLILVTSQPGCESTATWRWSGATWALLHPAASPPPAAVDSLAYDPRSESLDLVTAPQDCDGGTEAGSASPPVWSWNGSSWNAGPASGGSVPPSSWELTTSGDGALLVTATGTYLWKGGGWSELSSSPVAGNSSVAYDASDDQVVLFGGICASCGADAVPYTWTWDGSWALRNSTAAAVTPAAAT